MAVTDKKYHVGLGRGDVGEYVLVPGDPFRTPLIAKYLDGAREVAFSREYRTFTGKPDGYVPKEYPAVASLDVVNALIEAAQASGARYHVGLIRSVDALYSDLLPDQMPRPHLRDELAMW